MMRPRAKTSDTPITRWPGLASMQWSTSSSTPEKLRVTPVTMASASPRPIMQAAKWLRSWLTRRWQPRIEIGRIGGIALRQPRIVDLDAVAELDAGDLGGLAGAFLSPDQDGAAE